MQLNQLSSHLKNDPLAPMYFISGDTPLLVQEARDAIRDATRAAGYLLSDRLNVEARFDWHRFTQATQDRSLFSDKTLIDLRNPGAKFDDKAKKALLAYLEQPDPDKVVILSSGKMTSAQQKTKWFQSIGKTAVTISIWPIGPAELPRWIEQRLQRDKISADQASIQMLAELTEGHLLATQQAIIKLQLLYPNQSIGREQMAAAIHDCARFSIFDLSNAVLQGDSKRAQRICQGLREEGAEPTLVLWALSKEIRDLINLTQQLQLGQSITQVISKQWQARKPLVKAALNRLNMDDLTHAHHLAAHIDRMIKGLKTGSVWDNLSQLSLQLTQPALRVAR